MKTLLPNEAPIPESLAEAASVLRNVLRQRNRLGEVDKAAFLNGWAGLCYIAPGLHPDEFENPEGGWPVGWKPLAAEAFARHDRGELADNELYPSGVALAALGIYPESEQ